MEDLFSFWLECGMYDPRLQATEYADSSRREMAVGNTFGATALSSYGGFWIAMAITFTPGGFGIETALVQADKGSMGMFYDSLGLFLMVNCTHTCSPFQITLACSPICFVVGVVHIHLPYDAMHREIDCRFLLAFLLRRPRVSIVGHWLHAPQ